jgi:hypothetical protein
VAIQNISGEKGNMKKSLSVLCILAITMGFATSSKASVPSVGDPGRSWTQPNDAALGQHIQWFIDTAPNDVPSFLIPESTGPNPKDDPTCTSSTDAKCAGQRLNYSAVLPKCQSEADVNCTADFGTIDASGVKTSANFARYFPLRAQNQYKGDAGKNLPDGVAGSLYTLPSAAHDGGDKYYLSVALTGGTDSSGNAQKPNLEVRVTPVALETSGYFSQSSETVDVGWAFIKDGFTGLTRWGMQASGFSGNQYCVANSTKENLCAQKYAFPADTRMYVTLRLSQLPVGWMHGRISAPDIQITAKSGYSDLEIQGNPVAVPVVYKKYQYTEMPEALKSMYSFEKGGYIPTCPAQLDYCAGGRSGASKNPLTRNVIIGPSPSSEEGMEQLKLWIPYVNDKATALMSFWSARTLSGNEMSGASECFADSNKITGIVTTNSTQYSAGPPKFTKSEGTLDYQVSSPHYGTTGDVFKGSYDLVMRSDVARCIYGFSKAPINATLSITSSDGTPQVATTVIGEKNGWLYLQAKNFEFSAPVIKAKLTQEGSPKPASKSKAVGKNSTITCSKGKDVKRIYGVKPKCPAGYKKR